MYSPILPLFSRVIFLIISTPANYIPKEGRPAQNVNNGVELRIFYLLDVDACTFFSLYLQ
jgi:hypothetical protein